MSLVRFLEAPLKSPNRNVGGFFVLNMHFLYIIYSDCLQKYYVGESPDVEIRLSHHNNHYFKTNFTKSANDWKLSIKYECKNRGEALFLEKFIKKMKSRVFIEKIVSNPEILVDLLRKYSP